MQHWLRNPNQEASSWQHRITSTTSTPFERTSKRRKGYPSETQVKRGRQIVHGDKELIESLVATIFAPATAAGFKQCCMQTGRYDGTLRNDFF